jgi:hypothetical protein
MQYKFLGLCGGFYFIAIPFLLLIIYSEYLATEKEREYKEELLSRLPNEKLYLDISKEEKWMLDNLVSRSAYNNEDKFLRQAIKEAISKEYDYI